MWYGKSILFQARWSWNCEKHMVLWFCLKMSSGIHPRNSPTLDQTWFFNMFKRVYSILRTPIYIHHCLNESMDVDNPKLWSSTRVSRLCAGPNQAGALHKEPFDVCRAGDVILLKLWWIVESEVVCRYVAMVFEAYETWILCRYSCNML